jgi:hypothetical protein
VVSFLWVTKVSQIWFAFDRTRITSVSFYMTTPHNVVMSIQTGATASSVTSTLSPYSEFKMALKSKEVQRQYPNLL